MRNDERDVIRVMFNIYPISCSETRKRLHPSTRIPAMDRPGPERGGIIRHRKVRSCRLVGFSGETVEGTLGNDEIESGLGVYAGEFVAESKDLGSSLRFETDSPTSGADGDEKRFSIGLLS